MLLKNIGRLDLYGEIVWFQLRRNAVVGIKLSHYTTALAGNRLMQTSGGSAIPASIN